MLAKRILLLAPFLLIAILLQAYFWVPDYESQTRGNPARLDKFIMASSGDAKLLNPILHADASSGRIVDLVFEGLLDLDEDLNLRGRVAERWSIREDAYLLIDTSARFADGTPVDAVSLQSRLSQSLSGYPGLLGLELTASMRVDLPGTDDVSVRLDVPPRIKLRLQEVDQDLWARIEPLLGAEYGAGIDRRAWLSASAGEAGIDDAALAEAVPLLEHNPVIEFHLRDGVSWHDGEPVDAEDVRFTYESIMAPRNLSPRSSDFEPIKQVEVIDPRTVRVVYKRLFSPAINSWTMGLLPEHLLNEAALKAEARARGLSAEAQARFGMRDSRFNRNPIGSGPYRFVEWQSDEMIHLASNRGYWEGEPEYGHFYFRIIPDSLTQELEFRAGAIDAYQPQPHQVARYREDDRYQRFASLGFGYTYIGYNMRRPIFADARMRRALGMALNVDEIIEYVLYGEGERTTGPYPKNTRWYDPEVQSLPYDPDAALALLQEMGWRRNADGWLERDGRVLEFNLITNNGNLLRKAVMTIAQNNWRKIGIKVNTQLFEWAVFLQDFVNPGDFDAVILGWTMGVDPDLFQLWHSSQTRPQQLNFVGYQSAEADRLIERIRQEYDIDEQQRLARALHRRIAEDQPYTFLYAPASTLVLDRKIVMLDEEGRPQPLKPTSTGDVFFYFNRWTKLSHAPEF